MTTNVASIGFIADTSQLKTAKTTLDTLTPAARAAEQASMGLTQSMQQQAGAASAVVTGANRVTAAIAGQELATVRAVHANGIYVDSAGRVRAAGSAFVNISNQVVSALQTEHSTMGGTVDAVDRVVKSYAKLITAQGLFMDSQGKIRNALGQLVPSAKAAEARAELLKMQNEQLGQSANIAAQMQQNLNNVLARGSKPTEDAAHAIKIAGLNTANLAAQFQDIGVTAAMGMNPLMIALQQGTQISMLFTANSSKSVQVMKMLGEAAKQVFAPISLLTIGVVGLVAGLIQLVPWVKLAEYGLRGLASILKASAEAIAFATQLLVVFGLTLAVINFGTVISGAIAFTKALAGMAVAIYAVLAPFVGIPLIITLAIAAFIYFRKEIAKLLGPDLVNAAKMPFNIIIGLAVGMARAIGEVFKSIPHGLSAAWNGIIEGVIRLTNQIIEIANAARAHLPWWLGGGEPIPPIDVNKFSIPLEKGASDLGARVGKAFTDGMGVDYIGKIGELAEKGVNAAAKQLNKWADALAGTDKKYQKIVRNAEKQIALLKVEQQGIGQTALQYNILREQMELVAKAKEQDIALTPKMEANLKRLGAVIGTLKTQTEALQGAFNFTRDVVGGFVRDLRDGLKNGEGFLKAFANAALNILNKVSDRLIDLSLDMLFNTQKGGATGGALGGLVKLFGGLFPDSGIGNFTTTVTPSAKGNVFGRGGLIDKPTLFAFANGGALGMAGEAGTEAVMPLKRGPDGSLGVQVHGASNDNGPAVVVQVINNASGTEVRQESSRNGDGTEVRRIIIDTVRQGIGQGEFDKVQRARFGNQINRVAR